MDIPEIQDQLKDVRYPIASSLTLPPACYVSAEWFELEMEHLFRRGWICVGRADSWSNPGSYQTFRIAGMPVVVIRKQDDLVGLSNVCRHRGSQIMQGSGRCRVLTCPFHGWVYDLSGRLISASDMESAEGFRIAEYSLKTFPVEVVDGFVFVNFSDGIPLEYWLGEFAELHSGWMLSDQQVVDRQVFEVNCNWKQFLEVFNEYYHLRFVHPDSIGKYYEKPDAPEAVTGKFTTQFGITDKNAGLLEGSQDMAFPPIVNLDNRERRGVRYTWVYPNMAFGANRDFIWSYHVFPRSAGKTEVIQNVCFPSSTLKTEGFEDRSRSYIDRIDTAIAEDIEILERQFEGMKSPYAVQGRFGNLEPCVAHFACWYAGALGKTETPG